jgi:hypothetical protein
LTLGSAVRYMAPMHRIVHTAAILCLFASGVGAQTDHLKCYKMKDSLKLTGVLDIDSPQFGLDAGCTVSKAKLFCVPAEKSVVSATDRATGDPITPLPFTTAPTPDDRVCYKVRCPVPAVPLPDQSITDQFGNRVVSKLKASLICTPAVKGSAFCGNGMLDGGEQCDAGDLGGASCATAGFPNGGALACAPGCTFDTDGCARSGVPVTGQTIAYPADKNDGIAGAVAVADDGTLEAGSPYAYVDNGDGTVTDSNTGLMWEKKSNDGGLHDFDNSYRWSGDGSQETIWDWLDDVNA